MKPRTILVGIGVLFVAVQFVGIHRPFLRHREGIATQYALMAENHVRLGYGRTKFASYETAAVDPALYGDWRKYCYPNRPFLSVVATSIWFQVFGDREWVLRLSLIVVGLGAWIAFVALARKLLDPKGVPWAAALFALNPMFWYFSIVVAHLTYALAFSLAAWACWVRWDESKRYRVLTFVFLALACESDWPGYYATLAIAQDAFFQKRRELAFGLFSIGLACFGLHVAHLSLIDPKLVSKLLHAGSERSLEVFPSPFAFLFGEAREIGLYFTAGLLVLAVAGLRSLPRRIWLLALMGLDEILFLRWAAEHDFLTYGLTPFMVLAAVHGIEVLSRSPRGALAAKALVALAGLQAVWIMSDRLTRTGAFEVYYRAGRAIEEGTRPDDRILLTLPDVRQFTPYYARRYTAAIEQDGRTLMVHPSGGGVTVEHVEDLEPFFKDYSVVAVGDPSLAASEIGFFKGQRPPEAFRFLGPEHPLRKKLEAIAVSKETRGAFVLYRLR